ncbi:MAG: hypothetical protein LBG91_01960 [Treponema sp.]|jgi:hypothetical protein|nr:hypothetical protein [Treponema sp.]
MKNPSVYELFVKYSEKVEDLIDRLQQEHERFTEKIMKMMGPETEADDETAAG